MMEKRILPECHATMLYLTTCCGIVAKNFNARVYLIGSSLTNPEFDDIDLRCVMDDALFASTFGEDKTKAEWISAVIGEWLASRLCPFGIDFQFIPRSEFFGDHLLVGAE